VKAKAAGRPKGEVASPPQFDLCTAYSQLLFSEVRARVGELWMAGKARGASHMVD
jgi:hypothetical protein